MKLELTPNNIIKAILVGLGISSIFEIFDPTACWAAEDDLSESLSENGTEASYDDTFGVKDPRESPRGKFYFKLSASDVNRNDPVPFIKFWPRDDHVLTDFYAVRQEIFDQLNLEVESLVKADNPQQLVRSAKQRITLKLNHVYTHGGETETVNLIENASQYYKYRSYFESYNRDNIDPDFRNYWELHDDNLNEYNSNELNQALHKCINNSKISKDSRFINNLDSGNSDSD